MIASKATRPRRRRSVGVAVALAIATGACTHHTPRTVGGTASTVPTVYPLTGLGVDDVRRATRAALVVKIDNEVPARPQAGLEAADVVYEELIEGGETRFAAVFQSTDAPAIGPIRSVRPTDPDLVAPLGGLFAYSGGTPKFEAALHAAPVVDVGRSAEPGAYVERPDRVAPHRVYSSTARLYATPRATAARPPPAVLTFLRPGAPFDPPGAVPAGRLEASVGDERVSYDWDPGMGWRRSVGGRAQRAEGGGQLTATNVIVQRVSWEVSPGDFDAARSPVHVARLVGSGEAWVLAAGKVVKGRWSKAGAGAVTAYTAQDGRPLALPPGRTWIELSGADNPPTVR